MEATAARGAVGVPQGPVVRHLLAARGWEISERQLSGTEAMTWLGKHGWSGTQVVLGLKAADDAEADSVLFQGRGWRLAAADPGLFTLITVGEA